jgi:hypothetical protein
VAFRFYEMIDGQADASPFHVVREPCARLSSAVTRFRRKALHPMIVRPNRSHEYPGTRDHQQHELHPPRDSISHGKSTK